VAAGYAGLHIFDISDPGQPVEVGGYDPDWRPKSVWASGNFVYTTNGLYLYVLNVGNPEAPFEAGFYNTQQYVYQFVVSGNLIYAAQGASFGIYDCSEALGAPDYSPGVIPQTVTLYPCYPNPFNPSMTIRFDLTRNAEITLTAYDVLGRTVAQLLNGPMSAGVHHVNWECADCATGVYLIELRGDEFHDVTKATLLR
jgi:hypothetical protein